MNCPNCGKELAPGDKFCIGCGSKIDVIGPEIQQTTQQMPQNSADALNNSSASAQQAMDSVVGAFTKTSSSGVNMMVRRYFFGFGDITWTSAIIWIVFWFLKTRFGVEYGTLFFGNGSVELNGFGKFCNVIMWIAGIAFVLGIIAHIYFTVIGMGRSNVDAAASQAVATLKARAFEKFNVEQEQINEVEPIIVVGVGIEPNITVDGGKTRYKRFVGVFSKVHSKDPVEAYKVAKLKNELRSSLIQTTVYAFTNTQLLTYTGNIDLATGVIYDESVAETYYTDINSTTQRDVLKKYKAGIFKKVYYIRKYFVLDVCGITKKASFESRFASEGLASSESSLNGMQSYIRDKKVNG